MPRVVLDFKTHSRTSATAAAGGNASRTRCGGTSQPQKPSVSARLGRATKAAERKHTGGSSIPPQCWTRMRQRGGGGTPRGSSGSANNGSKNAPLPPRPWQQKLGLQHPGRGLLPPWLPWPGHGLLLLPPTRQQPRKKSKKSINGVAGHVRRRRASLFGFFFYLQFLDNTG